MRVYILGIDGYIGWALAQYLSYHGHDVHGMDNGAKRRWAAGLGARSVLKTPLMSERFAALESATQNRGMRPFSALSYHILRNELAAFAPDAIVNLAQQPSAPYSMKGPEECAETKRNNEIGMTNVLWAMREACPDAHLVAIGSMGELGTPPCPIPEPPFSLSVHGVDWEPQHFPRCPSSLYHSAKVASTHDIERACEWWGLSATDIMQGVVYGVDHPGRFGGLSGNPSIWADECFGTALNRFCAQAAIGMPLTVYGAGTQRRGFLPLRDSLQCLRLVLENPAEGYRCIHQFDRAYHVLELAEAVQGVGRPMGLNVRIEHLDNPRYEAEEHVYSPEVRWLPEHGYDPAGDLHGEIEEMLRVMIANRERIEGMRGVLAPTTRWR